MNNQMDVMRPAAKHSCELCCRSHPSDYSAAVTSSTHAALRCAALRSAATRSECVNAPL